MSLEEKARKLAEAEKEHANVDWNVERDWWLGILNGLYEDVQGWLLPLQQKGLVVINRAPVQLSEANIGVYAADALVLEFGPQGIVLEPKGTLIFGARGRVDVFRRGARSKTVMLILTGPTEEPRWEIWPTHDPGQRKPLVQSSFEAELEALLEV